MHAALITAYGPPEVLQVREIDAPTPGPREVLISARASSINPIDCKIRQGSQRAFIRLKLPAVGGMDISGEVVAVGAQVTQFQVGDQVVASPSHKRQGCHAEQALAHEDELAIKPPALTHAQAAAIPLAGLTAWDALVTHGKLQPGQRVLIQAGAGGVGTLAIQLASSLGAEVYTTCSARNIELVKQLGAHVAIDYATTRYEEAAQGCDLIVECLGPDHFPRALATVRRGGRIIALTSGIPEAVKAHGPYLGALRASLHLVAFTARARLTRGVTFMPIARRPDGATLGRLLDMAARDTLRPLIDQTFTLDDIAQAHRAVETGRTRGKVIITM